MRGAKELMAMRMRGVAPLIVNVDTDLGRMEHMDGFMQIEKSDRLHELDLRCVFGLIVAVSGTTPERVRKVAAACEQAGAARVVATTHKERAGGRFEAVEVTDTAGHWNWKQQ